MSTYVNYTPSSAISRAMFNFDVYSGWQNFKTSGIVRVSVSDSFSYWDYLSPAYSDFYSALYFNRTSSGEVDWDEVMVTSVREVLSIYNQFANINLQWVGDFDTGVDGSPNPEDVGFTGQSDINIAWINRSSVGFAGISGASDDDLALEYVGGAGDIFLNAWALVDTSLELNTSSRQILMHELGHSLGLSHPHTSYANGVPTISADYAATRYLGFDALGFRTSSASDMYKEYFSIMSYDDTESFLPGDDTVFYAHTPMILDVIALQQAYGLGAGTHGVDNDTIEAGTAGYRTYFDIGGIDTVDLGMYTSGAYLHMGTTITDAQYLVGVAMSTQDARSTITAAQAPLNLRWFYGQYENAIGGVSDDWIIGNALDNQIDGLAGDDLLLGGQGNDTFSFARTGNGVDTISDFEIGDVLRVAGASFNGLVGTGNGASLGANQVQIESDQEVTYVYVGSNAVLGADITITLSGLFGAEQFSLSGDTIGLQDIPSAYRYEQTFDQIAALGYTPDGASLLLKFSSGEIVSVPADEQDIYLGGTRHTVSTLVNDVAPQAVYSSLGEAVTEYVFPDVYQGPLDIDYQLIDYSSNAVIVGSAANDFLKLAGSGNKAADGQAGADVIDGGTGSTFISGGGRGDADTFFLDGRGAGVSWSTITDFEQGLDRATIWGWKAGVSRVSSAFADLNNGGASGYQGLTLHFEHLLPDGASSLSRNADLNSITLSGLELADFGASSIAQLNAQIAAGSNPHFAVGTVSDAYGEHGYLYIS
jgi:Ca2+-binding RTX toxin-like protein